MTRTWLLAATLCGCAAASVGLSDRASRGAEAAARPPRFALLVGAQNYKNLSPAEQLEGPRNDVALMRDLLKTRFGFTDADVIALVDAQATGDAIRAALKALSAKVRALPPGGPPAQVVVHFSGHGSQVPDQPAGTPGHDEADGLDETLVPFDAERQGGDQDVRDDDLNTFLQATADGRRARVWVVLDCCHSGTGTRGMTKVRELPRQLTPTPPGPDGPPVEQTLPAGAVVLSACRAEELEPEYPEQDRHFGLLTRTLVEVLHREPALSELSYDRLHDAILARYRSGVTGAPTPQLETGTGALLRSRVLGAGREADRKPYWPVEAVEGDDQRLKLKAGSVQGVTAGSLFEVYERPEEIDVAGKSLCWLKVEKADGVAADGPAFQWDDAEHTKPRDDYALPKSFQAGFAIERRHQQAVDTAVRLWAVKTTADGKDGPPLSAADLAGDDALKALVAIATPDDPDQPPWLVLASGAAEAGDLLLRVDGDLGALFPATGVARQDVLSAAGADQPVSRPLRGGWGPVDFRKDDAPDQLRSLLLRVSRARNLFRLAAPAVPGQTQADGSLRVAMTLLRINESEKRVEVAADADKALNLPDLQRYVVRVRNDTPGKTVFVTCLAVSPDMGVRVILPVQQGDDDDQKLEPGEEKEGRAGAIKGAGERHVLCVASVRPLDLSFLEQTDLPRVRSAPQVGPQFALMNRLKRSVFLAGTTRGGPGDDNGDKDEPWAVGLLQFSGVPRTPDRPD